MRKGWLASDVLDLVAASHDEAFRAVAFHHEAAAVASNEDPPLVCRVACADEDSCGCLVELDELPDIGAFVEVEGPDEKTVFAVSESLGLAGEPISESYLAMVLRRR